jgi:hypothetical protein
MPEYDDELFREEHIKEIKVLVYNENAVCEGCGNNDFHCNFFWLSERDEVFHGQDEFGTNDVWCHVCDEETNIINKEYYKEDENE